MTIPDMRFKIGDWVRCVDSTAWADHVTEGELYVVKQYATFDPKRGWLLRIEADDNGYPCTAFEDRFEPYIPPKPVSHEIEEGRFSLIPKILTGLAIFAVVVVPLMCIALFLLSR